MNLNVAELSALDQNANRIGIFFRLDTTPVIRLWGGVGACEPGVNVRDEDEGTYSGFGELTNIPEFQQLLNGAAERVEFTLSDISAKLANDSALMGNSAVKNKDVALGFGIMDQDWQLLGPVHWPFQGVADFVALNIVGASDINSQTMRTLTLSVGSGQTGRKRRGFAYWTYQDQLARSPTDKFCEFVSKLSLVANKIWPRF